MRPADARLLSAASSPFRKGIAEIEKVLSGPHAQICATWASQPFTRIVASVLDDLAMSPPYAPAQDDVLVQYGMTLGLSLARRLLEDPASVILPSPSPQEQPLAESYSQPTDEE